MTKEKLIIIGTGPAGLTAAIYAARAELAPLVLEGEQPGGQLIGTTEVENFPGFKDGIMGPELVNNMREQAKRFGAKTAYKKIDHVDFTDPDNLKMWAGDEVFQSESVIIATGASARWLNLGKGEERYWGKGYTACATCDGAFFRERTVAVVGGGDSAMEESIFLTKFAKKVYILHRRDEFRASKAMQKKVFENEKIEVVWNKVIDDLYGDGTLKGVELLDTQTHQKSNLEIDGLFMAIGHSPNTGFLGGTLEKYPSGLLKVHDFTKTKIPSVFVAGDVSDPRYRQAITAAGSGCMAALDAEHYLSVKES